MNALEDLSLQKVYIEAWPILYYAGRQMLQAKCRTVYYPRA